MSNKEILAALQDFKTTIDLAKSSAAITKTGEEDSCSASGAQKRKPPSIEVPQVIEHVIEHISKSGFISHPWKDVKPLFLYKLDAVMRSYNSKQPYDDLPPVPNSRETTFRELYTTILRAAESFRQAPFTVQRLCELISCPEQHYKRIDKFLHALTKNLTIVTTVDETGRKLSTAEETDLSVMDHQQADKLLALFDWINSTTETASNGILDVSSSNTSTVSESHVKHVGAVQTQNSSTSALTTTDLLKTTKKVTDTEHTDTAIENMDSNTTEKSKSGSETKSVKRSLDDESSDSGDNSSKRPRVEGEKNAPAADSTVDTLESAAISKGREAIPVGSATSLSDGSASAELAYQSSSNEDNTSQSDDSLSDPFPEDIALDPTAPEPASNKGSQAASTAPTTAAASVVVAKAKPTAVDVKQPEGTAVQAETPSSTVDCAVAENTDSDPASSQSESDNSSAVEPMEVETKGETTELKTAAI